METVTDKPVPPKAPPGPDYVIRISISGKEYDREEKNNHCPVGTRGLHLNHAKEVTFEANEPCSIRFTKNPQFFEETCPPSPATIQLDAGALSKKLHVLATGEPREEAEFEVVGLAYKPAPPPPPAPLVGGAGTPMPMGMAAASGDPDPIIQP